MFKLGAENRLIRENQDAATISDDGGGRRLLTVAQRAGN